MKYVWWLHTAVSRFRLSLSKREIEKSGNWESENAKKLYLYCINTYAREDDYRDEYTKL